MTLAATFTIASDPSKQLAGASADLQSQYVSLARGQTVAFAPDARFALRTEATFTLVFAPAWAPWADPKSTAAAPCLAQLGTDDDPGSVFRIAVTRELDAVLVSSAKFATPLRWEGDFTSGGRLTFFFAPFSVSVYFKEGGSAFDTSPRHFSLGAASDDSLPRLALGDPDAAPFAGVIGQVMLFDHDLLDEITSHQHSETLSEWMRARSDAFYATLGLEAEAPIARTLVGVMRADPAAKRAPRFDFIPRELLWPRDTAANRWIVDSSDHPPIRVNTGTSADHGVYSSFDLFCFTRHEGKPCLWGSGGQWFALEYAADGVVRAVQHSIFDGMFLAKPNRKATLRRNGADRIELVPEGWSNNTERVFATRTAPNGTSFDGTGNDPADLWPSRIMLARVPDDYDTTRGAGAPVDQDQPFKGAFSKRLPQIGMSSRGFDPSRLGTLNPGASDGALVSEQYYVFQQPADNARFYRIDLIATPYYLFSTKPDFRISNDGTIAYKSMNEALASESNSLGFNVGVGDAKLFELGLSNSNETQAGAGTENVLTVQRTRAIKYVLTLDRRWIRLNDNFVAQVLEEADRFLAGDKDPPPFHKVYLNFGTHYANAITYGSQSGSVQMFDVTTLERMSRTGMSIKAGIKIPVEGATVGVDAGHDEKKGTKNEISVRKESRASIEVGTDEDPVPILMDLRPIVDLMQPPYIMDERVRRTQLAIMGGWAQYVTQRPASTATRWEAPLLLQVRLKQISTLGLSTYARARAFLAGIRAGSEWDIAVPAAARRADCVPIWASATDIHVSASAPIAPNGPVATLAIPRSGVTPAIGFTGVYTAFDRAKIVREIQDEKPMLASPWGGFAIPAPATDTEINQREHKLLSHQALDPAGTGWYGFDALDKPLAQTAPMPAGGFYTDDYGKVAFRQRIPLDKLKPGPTFSTQIATIEQQLIVAFEVRLVDPLAMLDDADASQYKFA